MAAANPYSHPYSDPSDNCSAWYGTAANAYNAGHYTDAATALDHLFALTPAHAQGLHLRGLVAFGAGDAAAAASWVERALEIRPDPVYYNTLCVVQMRLRAFEAALHNARQGLVLRPDMVLLHYNAGLALQQLDRLEEAADSYTQALALAPDHSAACNNLGTILKALDDVHGAERLYRQAVLLEPANREALSNLGHVLLTLGRYEEGWPYFEYRPTSVVATPGCPSPAVSRLSRLPQWQGAPASTVAAAGDAASSGRGARLLVTHEQGFGDSLQFVRYLPIVLARFSTVGFVCPPALRRLYQHSFGSSWPGLVLLDALPDDLTAWDMHCSLLSLPLACGTRLDNLPAGLPYLYADPRLAAHWATRLAGLGEPALPRVGIVWAGGNTGWVADARRSLAPAQIAPLLAVPGVRWISLQKTDDPAKQADTRGNPQLVDWMDDVTDFADSAALIDNLDLVIAVDTSVAHLAAALGKPVWLLNRFAGCWRWLRGRDDSPWYPGMRLFTQPRRDDWADVLARVATTLERDVAASTKLHTTCFKSTVAHAMRG